MDQLNSLATLLGQYLQQQGHTVATAESCTGGMVAAAITSVAGSSAWFGYGFVTYSENAKRRALGVGEETLKLAGAVSEAVVSEMAAGALRVSGADWAIAVSGIAGPSTSAQTLPVGTVWFAIASRYRTTATCRRQFSGERDLIRASATMMAIKYLTEKIYAS